MMANLALEGKDTVGLVVADEEVRHFLEPTGSKSFLYQFLDTLANVVPQNEIAWTKIADYLLPE